MARDAIIEKINSTLTKDITSEMQVVYIMAEIRKLLERDNKKETYKSLNFYCNWALHTKLASSAVASSVVAAFDRQAQFIVQRNSVPAGQPVPNLDWTLLDRLNETIELATFYHELKSFSGDYRISGKLLSDDVEWLTFMSHYVGVIEDSPLHYRDSSLQYVNEVVAKKIDVPQANKALDDGTNLVFAIQWEWISSASPELVNVTQKIFSYPRNPKR